ncbi:glycosyltransferase family 39 protein [Maioricimonas rarisocia]|uniref:glycosyltransferase family 39 protein n=1 Tax=Maioricimonas rarisocia TaxID=2528026 RepID=UPI0018D208E5|nr:glycosyltransferase family 39 protein [Maioricimonas rarisocia]
MRLLRLGEVHYWFDETFSIRMAGFPLAEMVVRCSEDTHPPLFFWCLQGWLALFDADEWWTRLFSTLWSLGAVVCAFGFTYEGLRQTQERPASGGAALLGATLAGLGIALSPIHISWSQQVRMYAPVTCLALLSTWLLWRAIRQPESWSRWFWFTVVEIAGLYTHVTMLFVVAAHVLALATVLLQRRRVWASAGRLARPALLAMAAVGLASLPWMLVVHAQHRRVQDDFWIKPFDLDLLGEAFVKCFVVYQRPVSDPVVGLWIAQGLLVILVVVAMGRRPFDLLIACAAGLPFIALIGVSLLGENIVNGRYFIAGHSLACVAVATFVARLPKWLLRVPLAAVVVSGLGYFAWDYHAWRATAADGTGIPGMLETWREHRRADEPLVFSNPMFYTTACVYAGGPSGMKIFGAEADYPFFVGTALTSDDEYLSAARIDMSDWETVWVCDYGRRERFLMPVQLGNLWQLATEISLNDYSGTFFLRRYDRQRHPERDISKHHIANERSSQ